MQQSVLYICLLIIVTNLFQKFGLALQMVGCIVTPAGAAHPYRLVTSILSNLLKRYPTK